MRHALFDPTVKSGSVLEPACGRGHMASALNEFFAAVTAADKHDYGYGGRRDFLAQPYAAGCVDWMITNPPFTQAEAFVIEGLRVARKGVAIFARASFAETLGRYHRLFRPHPPSAIASFTERVPLLKGRIYRKASTSTVYAWFIWQKGVPGGTRHLWIRPCRKELERDDDYATDVDA
jgi:hypothetical protein